MGSFDVLFEKTAAVPPLKKWEEIALKYGPYVMSATTLSAPAAIIAGACIGQKAGIAKAKAELGEYKDLSNKEKRLYRKMVGESAERSSEKGALAGAVLLGALLAGTYIPYSKAQSHLFGFEAEKNFHRGYKTSAGGFGGSRNFSYTVGPARAFNRKLSEYASKGDVHKEYKRLAKLYHPDLGGDVEKMKKINEEWEKIQKTDWFNKLAHDEEWEAYLMEKEGAFKALFEKVANNIGVQYSTFENLHSDNGSVMYRFNPKTMKIEKIGVKVPSVKFAAEENEKTASDKMPTKKTMAYHASPVQDIKKFKHFPDTSGNNKGKVIFASITPEYAAPFGCKWNDNNGGFQIVTTNKKPPSIDNFEKIILKVTDDVDIDGACSMYKLKGKFKDLRYPGDLEKYTTEDVEIISETKYNSYRDMAKEFNVEIRRVGDRYIEKKLSSQKNPEKMGVDKMGAYDYLFEKVAADVTVKDLMNLFKNVNMEEPPATFRERVNQRENFAYNSTVRSRLKPKVTKDNLSFNIVHRGRGRVNMELEGTDRYKDLMQFPEYREQAGLNMTDAEYKKKQAIRRDEALAAKKKAWIIGGALASAAALAGASGAAKLWGDPKFSIYGAIPPAFLGITATSLAAGRVQDKKVFQKMTPGERKVWYDFTDDRAQKVSQNAGKAHKLIGKNYYVY